VSIIVDDVEAVPGESSTWLGLTNWMLSPSSEARWWSKFSSRFARLVVRSRLVHSADLDRFEDAYDAHCISDEEAKNVRTIDLFVDGVTAKRDGVRTPLILAVTVSSMLDERHVHASAAAATVLRWVGYNAEPVVAGSVISDALKATASAAGVSVLLCPGDLIWLPDKPDLS
jgi:hypothetical protein